MTWAEDEFGGADLGDKRLNKRLVLLADRLGEQPSARIPEACRDAAEMHAAYRFLGRKAVDWRELMQPHWDASARRMQSHPVRDYLARRDAPLTAGPLVAPDR